MNIVCLANSYKRYGRCVAGINPDSGQWLRPVSDLEDGQIPLYNDVIKVEYISPLDIVDIPLDFQKKTGHEVENFGYTDISWQVTGKAQLYELLPYCESELLYPSYGRAIPYEYLKKRSPVRTLQLIEVKSLSCRKNAQDKWRAVIRDEKYDFANCELSITDPIALDKLYRGKSLSSHCFLCLSLSKPWQPSIDGEWFCYRLVAGIIEVFPEIEMILTEMKKARWSISQGREYLRENFGKTSRYQLTQEEAKQFISYLRRFNNFSKTVPNFLG